MCIRVWAGHTFVWELVHVHQTRVHLRFSSGVTHPGFESVSLAGLELRK